jgi:hypothetical protein
MLLPSSRGGRDKKRTFRRIDAGPWKHGFRSGFSGEEKRLTLALVDEAEGDPREANASSAADCWSENGLIKHLQQDVQSPAVDNPAVLIKV